MASFRRTEYGYAQKAWVQPAAAVVAAGSAAAALALFAAATVQPVDAVYAVCMVVVCVLMARRALLKVEVRREGVHRSVSARKAAATSGWRRCRPSDR
jgi:hypothetical protein